MDKSHRNAKQEDLVKERVLTVHLHPYKDL